MKITRSDIDRMFPRGQEDWKAALARLAPDLCPRYGITTVQRWRHFLAQVAAETDGLALPHMRESMRYRPQTILSTFDYRIGKAQSENPRFKGKSRDQIALELSRDGDLLAETVYGGRRELGNTQPGDGAKFIGRGPLQTTGREWYAKLGQEIGVDLVSEPDLLEMPEIGIKASFAEWAILGCNPLADTDSVERVSKRVNGGTNGLSRRRSEYARSLTIWPDASDTIDAPITPRHADAPPETITAASLAADGSRSMSWLMQLRMWLGLKIGLIITWLGLDNFDSAKGTLNELKGMVADHALVILLGVGGLSLLAVLVIQHFYVQAARDGRYVPAAPGA
jgi:predicted chitinase